MANGFSFSLQPFNNCAKNAVVVHKESNRHGS